MLTLAPEVQNANLDIAMIRAMGMDVNGDDDPRTEKKSLHYLGLLI